MITSDVMTSYLQRAMPDAVVSVIDLKGTMDHFKLKVVSDAFVGKPIMDRHRMIYQALDEPMKDGRIHALEITAEATDGS